MSSQTVQIQEWFFCKRYTPGIHHFDVMLRLAVEEVLSKSGAAIDSYVHAHAARLWNDILKTLDTRRQSGVRDAITVVNRPNRTFHWTSYEQGKSIMTRLDARYMALPAILSQIRELSWREYEGLGGAVSKLLGASEITITKPGADQGIDFFALIETPAICHLFSGSYAPLRIVGQSKKYDSPVPRAKIDEFTTVLTKIRMHHPDVRPLVPDWFLSSKGLIAGWIVAHRGYNSGALSEARRQGVILSDSIDIAEISAISRELKEDVDPEQRAELLQELAKSIVRIDG
jgi:hypothetical protein